MIRQGLTWICVTLLLAGCAAAGVKDSEATRLRERVEARWQAILALDFDHVYQFATPDYRATHSLEHFKNQYAAQVERKGIEVRSVEFDPEDPNLAKVLVILRFQTSGVVGPAFEGTSRVTETWIKQQGQWWHVEPR